MAEKVYITTRTILNGGDPIANVKVSLYPSGGGNVIIESSSDAQGLVYLGERDAGTYEIHISPGVPATVTNGTLQAITVVDGSTNYFDLQIIEAGLQTSSDSRLCRCSGYFVDVYGLPIDKMSLHFSSKDVRTLSYYAAQNLTKAVIPRSLSVQTDSSGFVSVDLFAGETYHVFMEGYENMSRDIVVPDLTAASLPDVLFPVPARVEYRNSGVLLTPVSTPSIELSLSGTSSAELTISTIYRSGLVQDGFIDVTYEVSDTSVAKVSGTDDNSITIGALGVGSATLQLTRGISGGITVAPDLPALSGNLSITVVE